MVDETQGDILCRDFGVAAASGFRTDPLSFRLTGGSVLALVGPLSCGKSLVLESLAGVRRPSVERFGRAEVPAVGFVPQDARLAALPTDRTFNLVGLRGWPQWLYQITGLRLPSPPFEEEIGDLLLRLRLDPDRINGLLFRDLSLSERRSVLLASQLRKRPKFLLIDGWDEMTDDHGRNALVEVLRPYLEGGMGLLVSSRRSPPRGLLEASTVTMGSLAVGELPVPLIQKPKQRKAHGHPLLEVARLTATRRRGSVIHPLRPAVPVDGASLFVRHGECVVLLGAAGSGKTTFLTTLAGLLSPQKGRIRVDNHDVTYARGARARRLTRDVQLVFQDASAALDGGRTVAAHLEEAMALNPRASGSPSEWLERLGLSPRLLKNPADHLSASESQRVDLARSLVLAPRLVLFDSPEVSAADVDGGTVYAAIRAEKAAGRGFLIATSRPEVASALADRVAIMHAGRIVELGDAQEVLGQPGHPVTQALLTTGPLDPSPQTERAEGCPHVQKCARRRLPDCSDQEPMLAPLFPRSEEHAADAGGHRVACFHPISEDAPAPKTFSR